MAVDSLDTNLLASGRKPKATEPEAPPPGRQKRILKGLAYAGIFLCALLFFFYLKTPSSLVEGLVMGSLNQSRDMQFQAEKVSARFFLLPHIRAEKLSMEPLRQGGMPGLEFSLLRIFPSFPSLIPWTGSFNPSVSFDGEAYGSEFTGRIAPTAMDLGLELSNLDLAKLTPLLEAGISLKGIVSTLKTDLAMENNRLSRMSGTVAAKGKGFVIDPGAFQIPMALPVLDIGALELEARADKGKVQIEKMQLGSPGKDIEARITGDVQLSDNIPFSKVNLRVKLKPSEKILQALPAVRTMLGTMGALQADGFYAMKFSGTLANIGLPQPDK